MIGENFPYTNFHDLNLDWMIKIAKDFLDQYTHIQETIEAGEQAIDEKTAEGIADLDAKAEALEGLLQAWYDEHSEDIADELSDALESIGNSLYETINNFNIMADEKAIYAMQTIPDDYLTLYNKYVELLNVYTQLTEGKVNLFNPDDYLNGQYYNTSGVLQSNPAICQTGLIPVTAGEKYTANHIDGFVLWYKNNTNPNLFDGSDFLDGQYYDRNGVLQPNPGICQTGIISVTAGQDYTANYIDGFVLWYTDTTLIGNTASEVFTSNGYVTAPAGANGARFIMTAAHVSTMNIRLGRSAILLIGNTDSVSFTSFGYVTAISNSDYARFIVATAHVDDFIIQHGETIEPLTVTDAVLYSKVQSLTDDQKQTARDNIDALEDSIVIIKSKNLFNPDDYLNGQYYDTSGVLQTNAAICQTGLIPVTAGEKYTANHIDGFVLWYTYNTIIGNTSSMDFVSDGYATAPSGADYARFIVQTSNIEDFQVEHGENSTAYIPYNSYIESTEYYNKNAVVFGTSLTRREISYMKYLPLYSGMIMDNQGVNSGMILENASYPDACILDKIEAYTGYSDKDICLLEGFVNDWLSNAGFLGTWKDTGTDTVCGCVRNAIEYIFSQKEDITLFVIIDHYGKTTCSTLAENSANKTQYEFYNEIIKLCNSMGVHVIKQNEESEINENTPSYLSDNIHPTELGAQQSAQTIWSCMKKYNLNK